jgi:Asp-tRNA(Asn)/Glu-tRNA(Gln) amidotransferase A subunit family amidase
VPIGVQLTSVEGPLARRIADLRAAFAVMAGPSWRDPWTVPDMINMPDIRAGWQLMSSMIPADTQRFLSAFYQVAGDPDPVRTLQSFMIRHRCWGPGASPRNSTR